MRDDCTQNMVIDTGLTAQLGRYQFGPESNPDRPFCTHWAQEFVEAIPWAYDRMMGEIESGTIKRRCQSGEEVWGLALDSIALLPNDLRYLDEDFDSYSPDE